MSIGLLLCVVVSVACFDVSFGAVFTLYTVCQIILSSVMVAE